MPRSRDVYRNFVGKMGTLLLGCVLLASDWRLAIGSEPDFQREVRPILARFCLKCHGPDEAARQSQLRFDTDSAATNPAASGLRAIVPHQPQNSELWRRIHSPDPATRMPPPDTGDMLTDSQRTVLTNWIAAGARLTPHWSFIPPQRPAIPRVRQRDWSRNAIDDFVLAALEARDWQPAAQASRVDLLRRVSLDLIGLPPSPEELADFLADEQPDAYDRVVDRLLASPKYGEHWARSWLDLARYADTNGYEKDRPRTVWPYRDGVINAFNADQPYDQFSLEQLAGDLLPDATLAQQIATGFHRHTLLNEEGGIDPQEFRFHALTDRVATTGTTWLGLTVGCAQCHTHKYDPLTHVDYYRLLAILNQVDEPELELPDPDGEARRQQLLAEITERERELPQRFPSRDPWRWSVPRILEIRSEHGATMDIDNDGVVQVSGNSPETDVYSLLLETDQPEISALQIEVLTDSQLPGRGPGRTPHGNFVITGLQVDRIRDSGPVEFMSFQSASADFSQEKFPAEHAIDEHPHTGWAIQGTGNWHVSRHLTARFAQRVRVDGPTRWRVRIEQSYGSQHTLGRFRVLLGNLGDTRPLRVRCRDHFQQQLSIWLIQGEQQAVDWSPQRPVHWSTTSPRLQLQADDSLLASGDLTKRDEYRLEFDAALSGATALRLEVLPDPSLPRRGPGLVYYEGPPGDFFLSEFGLQSDGIPQPWSDASHSFAHRGHTAAAAIDGNPLTGWSIEGGQGQPHVAIFRLQRPLPPASQHQLTLTFERHYAAALGRFRISMTRDALIPEKIAREDAIERLLRMPASDRTAEERQLLIREFCRTSPHLAAERASIDQLRRQLPMPPTSLVCRERPADFPRTTRRRHRGEYLQPREAVAPGVPQFLPQPSNTGTINRLTLARWLFDDAHPLTARVTVNRHWEAFFGRGLVATTADFGLQGELPTHPLLLDWLACEFAEHGWSLKRLHRLLVTSATYQQTSQVSSAHWQRDPDNRWLARGTRLRLTAEQLRDRLLFVSGRLSDKQLGPSVFPPQPTSVTTEGTYGQLPWTVSPGEDRYRRGLYTFAKRTAPYAMFATFDAPSREVCQATRERSNTPLQSLTLLNDAIVLEAARALGESCVPKSITPAAELSPATLEALFLRIIARQPDSAEMQTLQFFAQQQRQRLYHRELLAGQILGDGDDSQVEAAVATLVARTLLNLDEFLMRP